MSNFFDPKSNVLGTFGRFNEVGAETIFPENCKMGSRNSIGKNVSFGNRATIGNNVSISDGVTIGDNVTIHDNCIIRGNTTIGNNNEFLPGCMLGFWPKDIGDHHFEGRLIIGNNNFFGEGCVINVGEATDKGDVTEVGNFIYAMDYVTINHNCKVAVRNEIPLSPARAFSTILSSKVSLAGHVEIATGCNLGMQTVVHQFCKVGAGAMLAMNSNIVKNVPPFAKVIGCRVVGINKRPLAENMEFETYEDNVLETVLEMLKSVAKKNVYISTAKENLAKFSNRGRWNSHVYDVIMNFLDSPQNGKQIMPWKE